MKAKDIFTPGQFPTVTYVSEHLEQHVQYLKGALEAGGLVISISGPSKSGKTVFIEKQVGKDNLIHVTGAGIDSPAKLWNRVFDIIGTPTSKTESTGTQFTGTFAGKAGGELGLFVKGTAEVSSSGAWSSSSQNSHSVNFDSLQLL